MVAPTNKRKATTIMIVTIKVKLYLREDIWAKIYEFLRRMPELYVKNAQKTRLFIEAIVFMVRTGVPWRYLNAVYGDWRAIYKRFLRWAAKGIWMQILGHFSQDCDGENIMIDSTIVRAHASASGYKKDQNEEQGMGRSRGGFTTKIHAVVDALGQLLKFVITPGQRNDITQAEFLIQGIRDANIIADKGYDSDKFIAQICLQNCVPVIPPKSNRIKMRSYDEHLYVERHSIECFFGKIKHFRRIATRYDKKLSIFSSFFAFAATLLWLR